LLGDRVGWADLPELPELDNLFAPGGVIQQAQILAAETFGAEQTWFLANGSTSGVMAAMLATCNPGDPVILPRNVHQSVISGLVLTGAMPIFIEPEADPQLDLAHCVAPSAIAQALIDHPNARAVLIVSPTYLGVCGHVAAIADLCHAHHLPLIVDEAHGAHFGFHPDLPISALQAGADVAIQSTHKVLTALTQAAMIHAQGDRIDRDRLTKALAIVQSTSPNYLLLASLDAARRQMALHGKAFLTKTLRLASEARSRLAEIPGLTVLDWPKADSPGVFDYDRTRLTVTVSGFGLDGFTADDWLNQHCGVIAELPTLHHLTLIFTVGNTQEDCDRLVEGLERLRQEAGGRAAGWRLEGPGKAGEREAAAPLVKAVSPRDAFFAPQETVAIAAAVNRISAELVCPYPPGIPILLPGEVVTAAAIAQVQQILAAGGVVSGCRDPTLATLRVLRNL
jgi:arginine/lysine/ornithine decarboxylase